MRFLSLALGFTALLAVRDGSRSLPQPHGTYAVWICPDGCTVADTASARVAGVLVLGARPVPVDSLPEGLRDASMMLLFRGGPTTWGPATACFHLEQRVTDTPSNSRVAPRAATRWTLHGDTISVRLHASPDASYSVEAVMRGDRLVGRELSSGFVVTSFAEWGGDFHGVRLGPADWRRCEAP